MDKHPEKKEFHTCVINRLRVVLRLPPKELSPNARPHRMAKAAATKLYRQLAWATAREALGRSRPKWTEATARVTFYFARPGRRDRDNLISSLKSAFDGLVDAGLLVDDENLIVLPPKREVDASRPRVEIEVWEGEP